jgi:hypothetical protein
MGNRLVGSIQSALGVTSGIEDTLNLPRKMLPFLVTITGNSLALLGSSADLTRRFKSGQDQLLNLVADLREGNKELQDALG